jgi:cytochrome bd-type quinol oxidase subunit 2
MRRLSNQQSDDKESDGEPKPEGHGTLGKTVEGPLHTAVEHILHSAVGSALWSIAIFVIGCVVWNHADNPVVWLLIPISLSLLFIWISLHLRFTRGHKNLRKPLIAVLAGIVCVWSGYFIVVYRIVMPSTTEIAVHASNFISSAPTLLD